MAKDGWSSLTKKIECPFCQKKLADADIDRHLLRDHWIETLRLTNAVQIRMDAREGK